MSLPSQVRNSLCGCVDVADYVLRMAERGYPAPVKLLRYLAWVTARRRSFTFQIPANDDGV
jgi:hypothetical protein